MKIKKILFPFYKPEEYGFLKEKWWFRLLILVFLVFVIVAPLVFASYSASSDWCWSNVQEKIREGGYPSDSAFREHSDYCVWVTQTAAWESLAVGVEVFLFSLYVLPLIFFKVIIDYVVLGGRKNENHKL